MQTICKNTARVAAAVLSLTLGTLAFAQGAGDRKGTFEAGFTLVDLGGQNLTGTHGSSLDVSDDLGWGFEGAYNFTNRLAVGAELLFLDPSYRAEVVLDPTNVVVSANADLDLTIMQLKGIFNFLDGAFTPFVEAGIGYARVDSNIADGPPTTGCWWDPWWGYICTSFYDTYSDTRTMYSAAVGVRWDISRDLLLRASYGYTDLDTGNYSEDFSPDALRVELAWKF